LRWLVIGASGLLGHSMVKHLANERCEITGVVNTHPINIKGINEISFNLANVQEIPLLVEKAKPDVVIHTAGLTNVDACEITEDIAQIIHSQAAEALATSCKLNKCKFVLISTDHLWDGKKSMMCEDDPLQPINAYARTKSNGERLVRETNPEALIIRTNFFGEGLPWRKSISDWMVEKLSSGNKLHGFSDSFFTPISLVHLTKIIFDLAELDAKGIFHVAGSDRLSKYDFALKLSRKLSLPDEQVIATTIKNAKLSAPRPLDLSLCTDKLAKFLGNPMPSIDAGIDTLNLNHRI
jgi:dTDP-4-dehydrorhamnose reductase